MLEHSQFGTVLLFSVGLLFIFGANIMKKKKKNSTVQQNLFSDDSNIFWTFGLRFTGSVLWFQLNIAYQQYIYQIILLLDSLQSRFNNVKYWLFIFYFMFLICWIQYLNLHTEHLVTLSSRLELNSHLNKPWLLYSQNLM